MAEKDRIFEPLSEPAVKKVHAQRAKAMLAKKVGPLPYTSVSRDPAIAAVRAILELAIHADLQERLANPKPGRPINRKGLLDLLKIVEEDCRFQLGVSSDPAVGTDGGRVGTAGKGALVQCAADKMNLSPSRVRDLARQLADLAGTLPEKMMRGN